MIYFPDTLFLVDEKKQYKTACAFRFCTGRLFLADLIFTGGHISH